ncbi:hypothetical protein H6G45_10815 [Synechocystis sp. FACHB-383]|uniref:hypothetical protein n=1 Tax=Synechocystis sp. FACHB-383 TaxID=2692864 RepID=UPI00168900CE|nr:hypothetical protein [Synechocystis sp. FACHB-383]MBD2653970.1 hypothetical protein [Synechocystis sp. FACHB-383]
MPKKKKSASSGYGCFLLFVFLIFLTSLISRCSGNSPSPDYSLENDAINTDNNVMQEKEESELMPTAKLVSDESEFRRDFGKVMNLSLILYLSEDPGLYNPYELNHYALKVHRFVAG